MHPFVLGELACGNLRSREQTLDQLATLPTIRQASNAELLAFIERRRIMGRGIGFVDAHLLSATLLVPHARLLTLDRRLAAVASELGVGIE